MNKTSKNIIFMRIFSGPRVPTRIYRIMYPILITWNKSNVKKHYPTVKMCPETQELLHALKSTKTSLGCPEIGGTFHNLFTVSEYSLTLFMESSLFHLFSVSGAPNLLDTFESQNSLALFIYLLI